VEAVQIVQSHLLKGHSPTYGPVTARFVEYGIARLREEHKGQIVEPLAFLSLMRWLQGQRHLNLETNLRLRLGNESDRGSFFEEIGILYLFERCATQSPSPRFLTFDAPLLGRRKWPTLSHVWIKFDVAVDVLGGAPESGD
jgi:hypothetical protein